MQSSRATSSYSRGSKISRPTRRGFALVGVLIAAVIMVVVLAGTTKLVRNSIQSQHKVRQMDEIEGLRQNLRSVFLNEQHCKSAFRGADGTNAAFNPTSEMSSIESVHLGEGGALVSKNDRLDSGVFVNSIKLIHDKNEIPEVVSRLENGAAKNFNRYYVTLSVDYSSAESGSVMTLNNATSPKFFILVDPTTNVISGCDLNLSSGRVQQPVVQQQPVEQQVKEIPKNTKVPVYLCNIPPPLVSEFQDDRCFFRNTCVGQITTESTCSYTYGTYSTKDWDPNDQENSLQIIGCRPKNGNPNADIVANCTRLGNLEITAD